MAEPIGFIQCSERHCREIAEVRQAGGKRKALYTVCPSCGTNQGHGAARQTYLADNLKATREELEIVAVSDTEEKAAIPMENAAHSRLEEVAKVVKAAAEEAEKEPKFKDSGSSPSTPPPFLFGGLVLMATLIAAVFAKRKPQTQKEQTA